MADINNFTEISENFNTIKTLLNSIRAQGILNTSDVDKLLAGINSKLEKINTEEDIDLIKIFLSDLKQNLDERHSVLLSKFGAIESLFSNLLKNSSETLKSSEVKELFDIVATNLSVFSREVVSQKETLSDIILRLDTIRSDDSQKKEIIKNISLLKNDLERLTNGFDSIVLSLNENFKTVIRTISNIDPSEVVTNFGKELEDIANSSNTILSAIQMLDKKNLQIEDAIRTLATQDDLNATKKWISDLVTQEQQLALSFDNLADKYYKIDNLAEKIDASVEIIAGLKTIITDKDEQSAVAIIDRLSQLEDFVRNVNTNKQFEEFKQFLELTLNDISKASSDLNIELSSSKVELQKINDSIKALDINVNFKSLAADLNKSEQSIREHVSIESDKLIQLVDVNATRTLNELASNAESLSERLNETQNIISKLCEKSFLELEDNILGLKNVVSQIDENNVSANNAIFSNITDRLALFETSLKKSLEKQEDSVMNSSKALFEQISNIKDLSGVLDYKMDSSVIEINNAQKEFSDLKESVDNILALDFVAKVNDLKVDLYAVKQELVESFDTTSVEFSEKFLSDLFSKYELLISKLDNVEDEIKQAQMVALTTIKGLLESISSSLVDVLSYVSSPKDFGTEKIESRLEELSRTISDNNLSYVENVRDIIETVRLQVESNISAIKQNTETQLQDINNSIENSAEVIREDIKNSYDKLLEIKTYFDEVKDVLNGNNLTLTDNINGIISTASLLKSDFESKISSLRSAIIDKVNDFQKEFTCENADKISEIKFASENLHTKQLQNAQLMADELKGEIAQLAGIIKLNIEELTENLAGTDRKVDSLDHSITGIIQNDLSSKMKDFSDSLGNNIATLSDSISEKFENATSKFEEVNVNISDNLSDIANRVNDKFNDTLTEFKETSSIVKESIEQISEGIGEKFDTTLSKFYQINDNVSNNLQEISNGIQEKFDGTLSKISELDNSVNNLSSTTTNVLASTLAKILDNFVSLKAIMSNFNDKTAEDVQKATDLLMSDIKKLSDKLDIVDETIDEDLTRQLSLLESNYEVLNKNLENFFSQATQTLGNTINVGLVNVSETLRVTVVKSLEQYKNQIDSTFSAISDKNSEHINLMESKVAEINNLMTSSLTEQNEKLVQGVEELSKKLNNMLSETLEVSAADYNSLKNELSEFVLNVEKQNSSLSELIKLRLGDLFEMFNTGVDKQSDEMKQLSIKLDEISKSTLMVSSDVNNKVSSITENFEKSNNVLSSIVENQGKSIEIQISTILEEMKSLCEDYQENSQNITKIVAEGFTSSVKELNDKIVALIEQNTLNLVNLYNNSTSKQLEEISSASMQLKAVFESLNDRLDKDEISRMNVFQSQLSELNNTFNQLINEAKNVTKTEVSSISETLLANSRDIMSDIEQSIDNKVNTILATSADIAAGELQSMESFANKILEQVKIAQNATNICKTFITDFVKNELKNVTENIESESDALVKDLLEQMSIMRDFQRDEISRLATQIETSVEDRIYNNINELKSYIDVKTDSSFINGKLDNINASLTKTAEDMLSASNKLLSASVFENTISDLRTANNVLIESMTESLNSQIQEFIKSGVLQNIDDKFKLFDKKFVDTVVDKYEEIKIISLDYNKSFETIQASIKNLLSKFTESKEEIYKTLLSVVNGISGEVDELNLSFADIKAQLLNRSFDEAFQTAINTQLSGLEDLVNEQLGYLEDLSELCCSNLPELTEMNALVKYNIIDSLKTLNDKMDSNEFNVEKSLTALKTDVITQFLNIFNQISFVAEQEEILDFIQEKHSELITILSHIVTTTEDIVDIKDNVAIIDNKVDLVKDDINSLNEKISSIISSSGDIDYVYSLQDLESDIAKLRLTLNELKENNRSKELEELISSTNSIYKVVESLQNELPKFDTEEFKKEFESLNEDIVSISTRTNKLILASDESYKTLQENLQDFKLVINDLDERTRNFAHEAGIDRIDNKLGVINTMIQNGAKTNQVFNQVFEYLAEWVDNAGNQIAAISDKVESLDDIGQIKVMLEDLKAEAEDNTESAELVEALSNVFERQAKKISSLESKLDRVIVETTINSKSNKLDLSPFEETLNRFLVAIDDKMLSQQEKINSLELKIENVMSSINPKDTAQLSKKVGGMDRQIAKLNKSIEKIASHVVEK